MLYFCYYSVVCLTFVIPDLVSAKFYDIDDGVPFPKTFVGSNLFGDGKFVKKCFSMEDVALLSARSKFEVLMPNFTKSSDLENDRSVKDMLEYVYRANELINVVSGGNIQYITQAAYYDVVGGFLHFFYLPFVKFSFYAGTLTYKNTLSVYSLQNRCKQILNTNGNGWRQSTFKFLKMKYKIQPIDIQSKGLESETSDKFKDPCENLLLISDEDYTADYTDRELIISLPRIETVDNDNIISVWLPFKDKRNFILNSKSSAFVLTRYYVDVQKCLKFRNTISNPFNKRFQKLLHEKILPFIHNEEFYPGFGAILRVWESLKRNGVVVRSTYDYDIQSDSNHFWDETANLVNESGRYSQINNDTQLDDAQTANETSFFFNMIDSIKSFEKEWNQKQKTKYICLGFIITIIGLLIVILCMFISREKRMKNINRSTLTRERKSNWKRLLKSLSRTQGKNMDINDIEIESKYNDYDDTTSLASKSTSNKQTGISSRISQIQTNTASRANPKAIHRKSKYKTLCDDDYSTSSSSSPASIKSKKRRIYRKIREELKTSRCDKSSRQPRSIYSTLEYVPPEPGKDDFKFITKAKTMSSKRKIKMKKSLQSEEERNSSSWETLPSKKVIRNVEN